MAVSNTVTLPVTKFDRSYDIVVVGGGTAGVMAAIAAAESGKDVLIAERGYALGGSMTAGQVTPFMNVRIGEARNSYVSARMQGFLEERGFTAPAWNGQPKTLFSPVTMSALLEEMCTAAGVELLYGAAFVNTIIEDGHIRSVLVQTLEGLCEIETRFVIDGTGDAQVAFVSGCPFEAGDPEDHDYNQNMSLRFAICDIDLLKANAFLAELDGIEDPKNLHVYMAMEWKAAENPLTRLFRDAVAKGILKESDGVYFQAFSSAAFGDSTMYFNCPEAPHCRYTINSLEVSQGVVDCRAAALRLHAFLKTYIRGFESSTISWFAHLPGVRESRRIVGEYYLTIDDYNERRKFKDGIAQSAYPIDVHGKSNLVHPRGFAPGEFFEIPYGTLVPKGIDNLLVAGRCISSSFWAQSAIRIQLVCHALGEAAGIAASMALDLSCAANKVDGAAVRAEMCARGGTFLPTE